MVLSTFSYFFQSIMATSMYPEDDTMTSWRQSPVTTRHWESLLLPPQLAPPSTQESQGLEVPPTLSPVTKKCDLALPSCMNESRKGEFLAKIKPPTGLVTSPRVNRLPDWFNVSNSSAGPAGAEFAAVLNSLDCPSSSTGAVIRPEGAIWDNRRSVFSAYLDRISG